MRKLIFSFALGFFFTNMANAQTPYKYRSSAIRNKYGHTVGRMVESNTSASKTTDYRLYNGQSYSVRTPISGSLSGKYGVKPTTRHPTVPSYGTRARR